MSPPTRRDFLQTIAGAGLYCAAPRFLRAATALPKDTVQISILHTTDLHGHILPTTDYAGNADLGGFARCATQLRRWRRQNRNSIVIDAGDVYQGTEVSLRTNGGLMIDLFNHLKFDAWIVGNHEFDWGIENFANAVAKSAMPVLAANMSLDEKPTGDSQNPFAKLRPYTLKEFDGIKIAIIGVTTPGMPFWFRPEFIHGFKFEHSVEPVRRAIASARDESANAIVLAGHMGLKSRGGGDDFANNVVALTSEFPEVAAFIAGHTHQAISSRTINGVLLTQADHFGIHVGRVDLTFDRASKKLLRREARCELMNHRIRPDHRVLSRARPLLDESAAALTEPIGILADMLPARGRPGEPSDVEELIGAAIFEELREHAVMVDGVMHGVFGESTFEAGPKTVNDVWELIPFENYLVSAALASEEIKAVMEEVYASREPRNLIGFQIQTEKAGFDRRITTMRLADGRLLERDKRYSIAFNSFDSRSGGHRFMKLRALLEMPATNCTFHPVLTRDAVIGYFQRHGVVHKIARQQRPATA